MEQRYFSDESRMQAEVIEWLRREWGYREVVSAEEDGPAWGSPIDSVGIMNRRIFLIEFKTKITSGMIYDSDSPNSSIESKIFRTLNGVLAENNKYNYPIIRKIWDRVNPLIFVVLAKEFTNSAREQLDSMINEISQKWFFDGRVWQWTGHEVRQIFQCQTISAANPTQYSEIINAPKIPARTLRRNKSLDELLKISAKLGLDEIFQHSIEIARYFGFNVNTTGSGVTFIYKGNNVHKRETSISMHVTKSSAALGMIFSFMSERDDIEWDSLPGSYAPKTGAYPVPNKYIRTQEEAEQALALFVR